MEGELEATLTFLKGAIQTSLGIAETSIERFLLQPDVRNALTNPEVRGLVIVLSRGGALVWEPWLPHTQFKADLSTVLKGLYVYKDPGKPGVVYGEIVPAYVVYSTAALLAVECAKNLTLDDMEYTTQLASRCKMLQNEMELLTGMTQIQHIPACYALTTFERDRAVIDMISHVEAALAAPMFADLDNSLRPAATSFQDYVHRWKHRVQNVKLIMHQITQSPTLRRCLNAQKHNKSHYPQKVAELVESIEIHAENGLNLLKWISPIAKFVPNNVAEPDEPFTSQIVPRVCSLIALAVSQCPVFQDNPEEVRYIYRAFFGNVLSHMELYLRKGASLTLPDSTIIWHMPVEQFRDRVIAMKWFLGFVKHAYSESKLTSLKRHPTQASDRRWNTTFGVLFSSFDLLMNRAQKMLEILEHQSAFSLASQHMVEGYNTHSDAILHLTKDFKQLYDKKALAIMEPLSAAVESELDEVHQRALSIKKHIGIISSHAMRDAMSESYVAAARCLEMYEPLFDDITTVKAAWKQSQQSFIKLCYKELIDINGSLRTKTCPIVYQRYSSVVANYVWKQACLNRVLELRSKLDEVDDDALATLESMPCLKLCSNLIQELTAEVSAIRKSWASGETTIKFQEELQTNVLCIVDGHITVNLSQGLTQTLKDTMYFASASDHSDIVLSDATKNLLEREHIMHECCVMLQEITQSYNDLVDNMKPHERDLCEAELQQLRDLTNSGAHTFKWDSESLPNFVKNLHHRTEAVSQCVYGLRELHSGACSALEWAEAESLASFPDVTVCSSSKAFVEWMYARIQPRCQQLSVKSQSQGKTFAEAKVMINSMREHFYQAESGDEETKYSLEKWTNFVRFLQQEFAQVLKTTIINAMKAISEKLRCRAISYTDVIVPELGQTASHSNQEPIMAFPLSVHFENEALVFDVSQTKATAEDLASLLKKTYAEVVHYIIRTTDHVCLPEQTEQTYYKILKMENDIALAHEEIDLRIDDVCPIVVENVVRAVDAIGIRPLTHISSSFDVMTTHGLNFIDSELRKFDMDNAHLNKFILVQQVQWIAVDFSPLRTSIAEREGHAKTRVLGQVTTRIYTDLEKHSTDIVAFEEALNRIQNDDEATIALALDVVYTVTSEYKRRISNIGFIRQAIDVIYNHVADSRIISLMREKVASLQEKYDVLLARCKIVNDQYIQQRDQEAEVTKKNLKLFQSKVSSSLLALQQDALFGVDFMQVCPRNDFKVYEQCRDWHRELKMIIRERDHMQAQLKRSALPLCDFPDIDWIQSALTNLKTLWDVIYYYWYEFKAWGSEALMSLRLDVVNQTMEWIVKRAEVVPAQARSWPSYKIFFEHVEWFNSHLSLVDMIKTSHLQLRHWKTLFVNLQVNSERFDPEMFVLDDVLNLLKDPSLVATCHATAVRALHEYDVDTKLNALQGRFQGLKFFFRFWEKYNCEVLTGIESVVDAVDDGKIGLATLQANSFAEYFTVPINHWLSMMEHIEHFVGLWTEVNRQWCVLFPIFSEGKHVSGTNLEEALQFAEANAEYMSLTQMVKSLGLVLTVCCNKPLIARLEKLSVAISSCEQSLLRFLYSKRMLFPRFFLVSDADLVDILSYGKDIAACLKHISKVIECIDYVECSTENDEVKMQSMVSIQGEVCQVHSTAALSDVPEILFNELVAIMRETILLNMQKVVSVIRKEGLFYVVANRSDIPAQAVVMGHYINFTHDCEAALQHGGASSVPARQLMEAIISDVQTVVEQGIHDTTRSAVEIQRIMWVTTVLLRARDILIKLMDSRVDSEDSFLWQSQMRFHEGTNGPMIRICDATLMHQGEYVGLCGSLVTTSLTNRCIITMTQALKLYKGGGPCGPAGTGKTETIKDLARNLGTMCYVFNCSQQMNHYTLENIIQGLSMCGAWGCFDEFNRITVEVLSVVATFIRTLLNALRGGKSTMMCTNGEITLRETVGVFVTINPGYLGRVELPNNLKALFRPCPMVVCDTKSICEILLVSEGFTNASSIAQRLSSLFLFCSETLMPLERYDWGLRALKGVIRVAGQFRRKAGGSSANASEPAHILQAIHYTTYSRLAPQDVKSFELILVSLFPKETTLIAEFTESSKAKHFNASQAAISAAQTLRLSLTENCLALMQKASQLMQLMSVSHSLILLGGAACGKTTVWKLAQLSTTPVSQVEIIAPKTLSTNELFGYVHLMTHEWKDGAFSRIFRDFAMKSRKNPAQGKWLVLDGTIDPDWVESLNSVMDDNKQLILLSNERIALHSSMKLVFECTGLENASPATVSRCSIMFVAQTDVGYQAEQNMWLRDLQQHPELGAAFKHLCDHHLPQIFTFIAEQLVTYVPVTELSLVRTIFAILTALVIPHLDSSALMTTDCSKFFFMSVHFAVYNVITKNSREAWLSMISSLMEVNPDVVKDTFYDANDLVFRRMADIPLRQVSLQPTNFIHTKETFMLNHLMMLLLRNHVQVTLCGGQGVGKTEFVMSLMNDYVGRHNDTQFTAFRLHHFSTDRDLEGVMSGMVEKHGQYWAPLTPTVLLIDDMSLPQPDSFGNQCAHEFIRIHVDHGFFYEHVQQSQKQVRGVQYLTTFNPTIGRRNIGTRLLWHFSLLTMQETYEVKSLTVVLESLVKMWGSSMELLDQTTTWINSCIETVLHAYDYISRMFPKTANSCLFVWSLRELKNTFYRVCSFCQHNEHYVTTRHVVRCFENEFRRMFRDRLRGPEECHKFDISLTEMKRKTSYALEVEAEPILDPCIFLLTPSSYRAFTDPPDWESVLEQFKGYANAYNDSHPAESIVLYSHAVDHTARLCTLLSTPASHVLLLGPAATGKKFITRFASEIIGYHLMELASHSQYNLAMMVNDLTQVYAHILKTSKPVVLIVNERDINDKSMLVALQQVMQPSKFINNLFDPQARDLLFSIITLQDQTACADAKNSATLIQERVLPYLHIVFCVSNVTVLEGWENAFPTIFSSMSVDTYFPWDEAALSAIAAITLKQIQTIPKEKYEFLGSLLGRVHIVARSKSQRYVTSKSYLEFLQQVKKNLKFLALDKSSERIEHGLQTIHLAESRVESLRIQLAEEMEEAAFAKSKCEALLQTVETERNSLEEQRSNAKAHEFNVRKQVHLVSIHKQSCEEDLMAMRPIVAAAVAALNKLDRFHLIELRSLIHPPEDVARVTAAVMVLTADPAKIPKARDWEAGRRMMGNNVIHWLKSLLEFDKDNIPPPCMAACEEYVLAPDFNPEYIRTKSFAAAGLCEWVTNMHKYHQIRQIVRPKEEKLAEAEAVLAKNMELLAVAEQRVAELEERYAEAKSRFDEADEQHAVALERVRETERKSDIATRLIHSLAEEKARWTASIAKYASKSENVLADAMLGSAFSSYMGTFPKKTRDTMWSMWLSEFDERGFTYTRDLDILNSVLSNEIEIMQMVEEGLARDQISHQNAIILKHAYRLPFLYDPENQALQYIHGKHGKSLRQIRASSPKLVDTIIRCAELGEPIIVTRFVQHITPVTMSVLHTTRFVKDGMNFLRIGEQETYCRNGFVLYFHTAVPHVQFPRVIYTLCSVIDFAIGEEALEEQLLACTLLQERPDLQQQREMILREVTHRNKELQSCENELLEILASATGDVLSNTDLIENLEKTKVKSIGIAKTIEAAEKSARESAQACIQYKKFAGSCTMMYFHLQQMHSVDHMYRFSLENFLVHFVKGIQLSAPSERPEERTAILQNYVPKYILHKLSVGLMPKDRLLLASLLTFSQMLRAGEVEQPSIDFLLATPEKRFLPRPPSLSSWCTEQSWYQICALVDTCTTCQTHQAFATLGRDIAEGTRWKVWADGDVPELTPLPFEWRTLTPFCKLLVTRCLRPDRVIAFIEKLVKDLLGKDTLDDEPLNFSAVISDLQPHIPVLFLLSKGAYPQQIVESAAHTLGLSEEKDTFRYIAMGQGQEKAAEALFDNVREKGGWLMIANIHLVPDWLHKLEQKVSNLTESVHANFRLILTSEPCHYVPVPLLQVSVKVSTAPPRGVKQNILLASERITPDQYDVFAQYQELHFAVSCLTFLYAVLLERSAFGTMGWNQSIDFSFEDVHAGADILLRTAKHSKLVWEGLHYFLAEVVFGGHITDEWDRRLCNAYVAKIFTPQAREGSDLCMGLTVVAARTREAFVSHIEHSYFIESPTLFGMHSSAAQTNNANAAEVLLLNARDVFSAQSTEIFDWSSADVVFHRIDSDITSCFPATELSMTVRQLESKDSFFVALTHEIERFNKLHQVVLQQARELRSMLQGEISMSANALILKEHIYAEKVPSEWLALTPVGVSKSLSSWLSVVQRMHQQLNLWMKEGRLLEITNFALLFNPLGILMSMRREAATRHTIPLDETCVEIYPPSRSAAEGEVHMAAGFVLSGARLELTAWTLEEPTTRSAIFPLPVLPLYALPSSKVERKDSYECPVYTTVSRSKSCFALSLPSPMHPVTKWIIGGVAMHLES
eukprot:PhF_6_TR7914/c0_g1_i1/m.11798/K10408/DNAH; dynein heavy chain, axonemal